MTSRTTLIDDLDRFCRANALFLPGQKILVAVSGGVDSVVLLDLLIKLKSDWHLDLSIVHVNHQLRGDESTGDEEFVRRIAVQTGLPIFTQRVDTMGLKHTLGVSKQVAAREARYKFFEAVRQQTESDRVATGHQADDEAETVLFNALRGSGVRGLAGIPIKRTSGHIIRPLLFARRTQILDYARVNGVTFRNDSSNQSQAYSRNYLRHSVVPFLTRELGTDVTDTLDRMSNVMKRLTQSIDGLIDERLPLIAKFEGAQCTILVSSLSKERLFIQEEIILRVLRYLDIEPNVIKVNEIVGLCSKQSGHSLNLSAHFVVYKDRDYLIFCESYVSVDSSTQVEIGHTYNFGRYTFTLGKPGPLPTTYTRDGRTEYVDYDTIRQPLMLRNWRPGDWFIPLGMSGKKKLSDFFNDTKTPMFDKMSSAVFESGEDIVWVCGKRLDSRYRITPSTRNAIKLTYSISTNPVN